MTKLIISIVFILTVVILSKTLLNTKKPKQYKYKRKDFFMSRAEHECYDALIVAVGEKYRIFPQVHLSSILDSKIAGQNWNGAFRHINQKSVDFVLCDKEYISPKLVIELDDQTHNKQNRKDRDLEVERILADVGLPILRLKNSGSFNPEELLNEIDLISNTHNKDNT